MQDLSRSETLKLANLSATSSFSNGTVPVGVELVPVERVAFYHIGERRGEHWRGEEITKFCHFEDTLDEPPQRGDTSKYK